MDRLQSARSIYEIRARLGILGEGRKLGILLLQRWVRPVRAGRL
jgi:hypothetical protein